MNLRIRILSAVNSMGLSTGFVMVLFFAKRVVVLKPVHVVISVCCFSLTVFPFSMFPANLSPRFDQGEDGHGYEHNKGNGCTDDSHQALGFHGYNLKKKKRAFLRCLEIPSLAVLFQTAVSSVAREIVKFKLGLSNSCLEICHWP